MSACDAARFELDAPVHLKLTKTNRPPMIRLKDPTSYGSGAAVVYVDSASTALQ